MMLPRLIVAAALAGLAIACATDGASNAALQETASLMVSIGQHGEGVDPAEAAGRLDAQVAANPNDPYILKLAATARANLADLAQDRAMRVRLRQEALAEFDRAIGLSTPEAPARSVLINGQEMDVDFTDLAGLRASLFMTVQTDR